MFFIAFVLYPALEILAFILVARAYSWSTVLGATLATSALGLIILQSSRRNWFFRSREMTSDSLKNYLFRNLGALALIWPGFISDLFGIILLIPPLRKLLRLVLRLFRFDLDRNSSGVFSVFRAYTFGGDHFSRQYQDYQGAPGNDGQRDSNIPEWLEAPNAGNDDIIDVEYEPSDEK